MQAHPDRLVFIDETSVKTNLTRQYGRSLCGSRLEMNAPFGAWGTQTFIAGLTQDNLIAPWIISGAMDGQAFEAYVRNVLAPELQPGTVVISTTLLPITITQQPQSCGTSAAGSFTCPRTRLTSTQLRWPSQNSRLTSEGLEPELSIRCSTRSTKSASSSPQTNVGTSSVRQDMDQVKGEPL